MNVLHFIDFETHKFLVTPLHRKFTEEGHNSQIIYSHSIPGNLPRNIDLLVVCQHWWRVMPDVIRHYRGQGTKILELEHGAPIIYNRHKPYRNTMKLVNLYACWGQNDYDIDANLFHSPVQKLRITGTPLFDRPIPIKEHSGVLVIDTHGPQHKAMINLFPLVYAYCTSRDIPCYVKIHPVNKESGRYSRNMYPGAKIIDGYKHIIDSMADVEVVVTPISASLIAAGLMDKKVLVTTEGDPTLKGEIESFIERNDMVKWSPGDPIDKAIQAAKPFDVSHYVSNPGKSVDVLYNLVMTELF
jgi:hypothetical protein